MDISAWRLAEVQNVNGIIVGRPSAPFIAANGWGASFALTTPFFIRAWLVDVSRRRRTMGLLLLVACVVPVVQALNRFVFISLAVALAYLAFRRFLQGDLRPLFVVLGVFVICAVLLFATPLGTLVFDRLDDSKDSNAARADVYDLAWSGTLQSPLIGHGSPTAVETSTLPPIGSHGLMWFLMYCFGFPGLFLFVLWLAIEVVKSAPARAPNSIWLHLALVIALMSVPIYGLLPQVVIIGLTAGLYNRENRDWALRRARLRRDSLPVRRRDLDAGPDEVRLPRSAAHAARLWPPRRRRWVRATMVATMRCPGCGDRAPGWH